MSDPIGTYTFLPWVRRGIANMLTMPSSGGRATVPITITASGILKEGGEKSSAVSRNVEIYGPGDIVGIDRAQISRMEPEHWVTNFEPNYFASIEFYDEDFPWRYTPAPPDGRRLLPWLTLVVLEEDGEFEEGNNIQGRPLPFIKTLKPFSEIFPSASEGWAWAHAHFNADFSANVVESDAALVAAKAQQVIASAPDTACSRLICPRKLKPKTGYHAFLIPAFESGRLAGLKLDVNALFANANNGLNPLSSAWGDYAVPANRPEGQHFPYYHRWYFRTAESGDFESLVRLLKPKVADPRVGHRPIDVTDPAPNIDGIDDPAFKGILQLGGALRAPGVEIPDWAQPYPHDFQRQLASFVNLADSYQADGVDANSAATNSAVTQADPDPIITPPIYGRWHAMTERLLEERDGSAVAHPQNWLHDLNLDPRWRTAAGFGAEVIQDNQEAYMEGAWDQIGDVLEANRRIRLGQFAKYAGLRLHERHIAAKAKANPAGLMFLHAPVSARVMSQGLTVQHQVRNSPLGVTLTSTAMRRAARPTGKLAKRLFVGANATSATAIAAASGALPGILLNVNSGVLTIAPPKLPPAGILTPGDLEASVQAALPTGGLGASIVDFYNNHPVISGLALALLLLLIFILAGIGLLAFMLGFAVLALIAYLVRRAGPVLAARAAAKRLGESSIGPTAVEAMPPAPGFQLATEIDVMTAPPPSRVAGVSGTDSVEAARFKTALRDQYYLIDTGRKIAQPVKEVPVQIAPMAADIVEQLNPAITVPAWTWSGITIPPRIRDQTEERFVEVMAYPEFDTAMYKPLADKEADRFVPNIHLVEPDSVTLLETNQAFIEAFMVGLNHEFARELLWREFPTDQRGSYFRQFWDVRKKIAEAIDKEAAREKFKDIKPLHRWPRSSNLGDHDNREVGSVAEEELVLVIRGELLKKYPNTVVSAQPARWQRGANDKPDKSLERELDKSVKPMTPLYEARVSPDVYFFGFDLTEDIARGDDSVDDKPGWFFRIEEVPGDARFGFDAKREADSQINVWNDLSWPDIAPGLADGGYMAVASIPSITLVEPAGQFAEKREQWKFDRNVPIGPTMSAAELAYAALQTPVLMAIHASELLPKKGS